MNIIVVIPAHNEAKAIVPLLKRIHELGFKTIVIDDGSIDDTARLAQAQGGQVIATGQKSGKGTALRLGFKHALAQGAEAVIALDGDGQHDPQDLPKFVEAYANTRCGIVNGNRLDNPQGMPPVRLYTNRFMSWLISSLCGQYIADTQCGYRLIAAEVLKGIELTCTDFEIETEILVKAARRRYAMVSVPIKTIYRDEVSKIKPVRDTIRFIKFIVREAFVKK